MMALERVVVFGILAVIIYAAISTLTHRVAQPRVLSAAGARWQAAHFARGNRTHVVVRKVLPDGATVIDEHLIATVAEDDPEYEARFLAAMSQARERLALYESEEP